MNTETKQNIRELIDKVQSTTNTNPVFIVHSKTLLMLLKEHFPSVQVLYYPCDNLTDTNKVYIIPSSKNN